MAVTGKENREHENEEYFAAAAASFFVSIWEYLLKNLSKNELATLTYAL